MGSHAPSAALDGYRQRIEHGRGDRELDRVGAGQVGLEVVDEAEDRLRGAGRIGRRHRRGGARTCRLRDAPLDLLEPLAAGEHEERGGAGHLGDVVAVMDEARAALGAVQMAEIHAIVSGDDQVGDVRVGVEEGEGLLEQAVRVVGEPVAGRDEEGQRQAVGVGAAHDSGGRVLLRGRRAR